MDKDRITLDPGARCMALVYQCSILLKVKVEVTYQRKINDQKNAQ